MRYSSWKWSALIAVSVIGVGLVTFVDTGYPALRTLIASWFLLLCPGLALIRLIRLKEDFRVWTLAIALSLALDALVAGIMLYAGIWSIHLGIIILMSISLLGLAVQILQNRVYP